MDSSNKLLPSPELDEFDLLERAARGGPGGGGGGGAHDILTLKRNIVLEFAYCTRASETFSTN